jgi:hypothetical protein
MGLKEIFSSLKSSTTTTPNNTNQNNNPKRSITNSNKKNRYNLHNYSLDNDLLDTNCILINKTNLNTLNSSLQTSPQSTLSQNISPPLPTTTTTPFVQLKPTYKSSTLSRRESTRSNASSTSNNEPTRLLIENHARHVNSILNINSQTIDYLNNQQTKQRQVDTNIKHSKSPLTTTITTKKLSMVTSPSCDITFLSNTGTTPLLTGSSTFDSLTPTDCQSRSLNPRSRIKTNPWIRSPSFHTTPFTSFTPNSTKIKTNHHIRSHTNDNIMSISEKKRFSKLNLSFNKADETICKKCFSLKCSCLQKSKDSGISSIISTNPNQLSPSLLNQQTDDSPKTTTSSSSSSVSSFNRNKPSPQTTLPFTTTDSLEQLRNNDDYSVLFEEALESSSTDSYSIATVSKQQQNDKSIESSSHFKRNAYRYSFDQNLIKRKSMHKEIKVDLTANFVAEVTNLFDKALLELPDFSESPKFQKQNSLDPVSTKNTDDDDDDDDLELENSVNELYKQIEILKEQKIMLDEKMKIAKLETTTTTKNNNDLNENNICKIIKEIRL